MWQGGTSLGIPCGLISLLVSGTAGGKRRGKPVYGSKKEEEVRLGSNNK